jgi:serine-type D-Ala-D-Ala carboxypeptidase/endopeptidase (penicillin-binding protein 4)
LTNSRRTYSLRGGSRAIRPGRFLSKRPPARAPGFARAAAFSPIAWLVLVAVLAAAPSALAAGSLRGPLADSAAAILGGATARAVWGILAVSLDRGDTLLALDPERRLIPGSNQKLLSNGAFLREVRPATRAWTRLDARGAVGRKGAPGEIRLKGDLILRGCGMPDIVPLLSPGSLGILDSLAYLLRASGLVRFEGTLWVDGALFAPDGYPRGWAAEDLPLGYGAPVNAILANGNAASVVATAEGAVARVTFDPPDTPLTLSGVVAVGGRGEGSWLTVNRDLCGRDVRVLGVVARGQTLRRTVSVPDPDSAAGLLLLGAMRRAGIGVKAGVRLAGRGAEMDPTVLPAWESHAPIDSTRPGSGWPLVTPKVRARVLALATPTARDIVSAVLAYSLNTESEALLRWLDPAPTGKTAERALAVLKQRLASAGIDTLDVSPVDGSGLSPQDLVTPRALVRWLTAMDRDSTPGGSFATLLPTPGARGTLEHRFNGGAPDPPLHAKTGTLTNVSALSGYVATGDGDRVAFSILSNGNYGSTSRARAAEEALVEQITRYRRPVYGPPAPAFGIPR